MALRDYYRKHLPDPYAALERQAIQAEDEQPPDRGCSPVPEFGGDDDTTHTEEMHHSAAMAPQTAQDLFPQDVKTINDWLTHIGETDTALISTLFKCCKADRVVLETTLRLAADDPPKVWMMDYKGQPPDEWAVVPPQSAPAPATVTCGQCSQFQPGSPSISIGVCLVTSHGLPPSGGSGYRACYPMVPRTCPNFVQEKN